MPVAKDISLILIKHRVVVVSMWRRETNKVCIRHPEFCAPIFTQGKNAESDN